MCTNLLGAHLVPGWGTHGFRAGRHVKTSQQCTLVNRGLQTCSSSATNQQQGMPIRCGREHRHRKGSTRTHTLTCCCSIFFEPRLNPDVVVWGFGDPRPTPCLKPLTHRAGALTRASTCLPGTSRVERAS